MPSSAPLRLAINGYGRIGRCFLRALLESPSAGHLEIVAINEPANLESMAYLTRYDSTHGRLRGEVEISGSALAINGRRIEVSLARTPEAVDWRALDIDLLIETDDPVDSPALLGARIGARLQQALGERRFDIVLAAPNVAEQPIHRLARETGIEL